MADGKPLLETWLENGLFASRWLMAPFYVGLVGSLLVLMVAFFQELAHEVTHVISGHLTDGQAILLALSLIDLSLAANLVLIVIFSGYENFVSKFDVGDHEDKPGWMGTVDFSGLKLKLIASIVAISGIALLRAAVEQFDESQNATLDHARIMWMVIVHLSFVVAGVLLALMDYLSSKSGKH